MTSLWLIDVVDARVPRPAGGSAGRDATPGAAAFADVIQDASRVQFTDDAPAESTSTVSALPIGTTTDAAADPSDDTATPVPTLVVSLPWTELPPARAESSAPDTGVVAQLPDSGETDAPPPTATPGASPLAVPAAMTEPTGALISASVVAASPAGRTAAGAPASPEVDDGVAVSAGGDDSATAAPVPGPRTASPVATPPGRLDTKAAAQVDDASAATTPLPFTPRTADAPPSVPTPAAAAPAGEAPTQAPTPATSAQGPAVPAPIVAGTPPAIPAAVAAAAPTRPVLLPQIAGPVVALAQAPDGDHRLTLTVSPENLGPVTVRAHISGGAIHIELHAPNDIGREALRTVLADLRRDLAAAAPHASLMLSPSDDGPGSSNPQSSANGGGAPNSTTAGSGGGQPRGESPSERNHGARPGQNLHPSPPDAASPVTVPLHGGIDVYA